MKRDEFEKVRIWVTFLTALLVAVAAAASARLGYLTTASFGLMVLGASFMTAHWWLLGGLVRSLAEGRRSAVAVRGMCSLFPAAAALAVLFVSIRLDRGNPFPVLFGIVSVPLAVSLYCLHYGVSNLAPGMGRKGRADV